MGEGKPIVIIEWRAGGHRLAYVSAVVRAAAARGCPVTLIATSSNIRSEEYSVHLAELASKGLFNPEAVERLEKPWVVLRVLRQAKRAGSPAVIPEGDNLLPLIMTMALLRQIPRPTATIMMRPPNLKATTLRSRLWPLTKLTLLVLLSRLPLGVRVLLLEDPLADATRRVWKTPLQADRLRLDDPCDLMGTAGDLPESLDEFLKADGVLAVIGSIDHRKKLPLIASAWQMRNTQSARLVIAGKQSPPVAEWFSSSALNNDPSVSIVDEYLENPQLMAIVKRSKGIISLQDGTVSSGISIVAATTGRWLISLRNTRAGSVAANNGFAELCYADPCDLARAMDAVLQSPKLPDKVNLPTSLEFGQKVLSSLIN